MALVFVTKTVYNISNLDLYKKTANVKELVLLNQNTLYYKITAICYKLLFTGYTFQIMYPGQDTGLVQIWQKKINCSAARAKVFENAFFIKHVKKRFLGNAFDCIQNCTGLQGLLLTQILSKFLEPKNIVKLIFVSSLPT